METANVAYDVPRPLTQPEVQQGEKGYKRGRSCTREKSRRHCHRSPSSSSSPISTSSNSTSSSSSSSSKAKIQGKRIDKKKRHDKPREFKEGGKSIRFITFNGWCGSQRK